MERAEALLALGLEESAASSPEALKRAYLKQVRVHSPERDPQGFQRVRAAYELLRSFEPARDSFQHAHLLQLTALARERVEPATPAALEADEPEPATDADEPESVTDTAEPVLASSAFERLQTALNARQHGAAAAVMLEIYAQATLTGPALPAQLTLNTILQLFLLGKQKRARRLLAAFERHMALVMLPLNPSLAATWKLLTELGALSRKVRPALTRALAESIASGQFQRAAPAVRAEIARRSEGQMQVLMETHAPTLFEAVWPRELLTPRGQKEKTSWSFRLVFLAILIGGRLLSSLDSTHAAHDYSFPTSTPRADTTPSLTAGAANALGDDPTLTAEESKDLLSARKQAESAYLRGLCDELRVAWGAYAGVARRLREHESVRQGYVSRRTQAIGACPELASELPEQP